MTVHVEIPDDLLAGLSSPGQDAAAAILELSLAEAYRKGLAGQEYIAERLGLTQEQDFYAFLDRHDIQDLTVAEFDRQMRGMEDIIAQRRREMLA